VDVQGSRAGFPAWRVALGVDWSKATVLDVGSGTGFYVEQWHKLGVKRVVGADITSKAVEELAKKFPERRVHRDGRWGGPLATPDSRLVTSPPFPPMDVLFHIVDDEAYRRAFANIASVIATGWLVSLVRQLPASRHRESDAPGEPLARRKRSGGARAGFEIVERVPMFVLMNYPD
jgi:SAM-dependent methyltransferase